MLNRNYHFAGENEIESPALVFYEDIIEENIKKTVAMAGGAERLWPHVKTYKTAPMIRLLMSYGIRRFKCATIAEAEMCAQCSAPHILVSYPLVGPAIGRFIMLQRRYTGSTFWAIGDDLDQLSLLGQAASAAKLSVPLLADVNAGMNRTGVPFEHIKNFCLRLTKIPGLSLMGLHCYDGHLGLKDAVERGRAAVEEADKLMAVRAELESIGQKMPVVVLGGTPTFPFHAANTAAFLSPGTLFIQDYGYASKYQDLDFVPGAAVLTRVVSRAHDDLFTLDTGYKAIASDSVAGERGIIADLPEACPEAHSEEHWVFRTVGACPSVGTVLYIIPAHICPTTALYPGVYTVRNGVLTNYWEIIARNRKISI
ncbi:MAG: D-TA family PLP-dependent enzyme [Spirochaetaceae bacterium]|jgi:D-serine deaminase-like pyridoxal phosphate-dependent protein|nr:D-TA family PLP-dependent enzyme [Spirochaetaceae bacterium]